VLNAKQISSTKTIYGPYDDNYLKTDVFGVETVVPWSPCGVEGLLNINSEVRLTPLDSQKPALMTVNTLTSAALIRWRRCGNCHTRG
jgi:hypothetical protein